MSITYNITTNFGAKDSLNTGDSNKVVRGSEFTTEFTAIKTALALAAPAASPTFTGTLTFGSISDGAITVTAFVDEDDMASNSATLIPTQQSVKAYVDSQLTAQDLDFQADSGGALSIDLDSETMTFTGGTGIDTSGSGNAVTFAIDSTVATLTGTQTLTNKTLTSPDVNTPDIDGGTIDNTVIGGSTAAAGSFTTVSATGNITVGGTVDGRDVATDGSKLDGIEASATADQTASEIRTLVESASDSNVFTDADHSKLNGIEASADVTDTANVTAAGALMDSELTSIASVKALNQGVATSDSPTFAGLTTTANVSFGDNDRAVFGAGSDLQIYHDGSDSYIQDTGAGDLRLRSNGSGVKIEDAANTLAFFDTVNNNTKLYHNNNQKLETTGTGIDVTGVITTDGMTTSADINFGDNDKAIFGAGSDLQIFHDASDSIILDNGTGNLKIQANDLVLKNADGSKEYLKGTNGGSVRIRHNNTTVLETTSSGIDVTGGIAATSDSTFTAASGDIFVTASTSAGSNRSGFRVDETSNNGFEMAHDNADNAFFISRRSGSSTVVDALKIDRSTGDFSLFEDTGTTAKFFFDASAESLGIGTTSPSDELTIRGAQFNTTTVSIGDNSDRLRLGYLHSGGLASSTAAGQIGTTSSSQLDLAAPSNAASAIRFFTNASSGAPVERLRIDSSGNVAIGNTSASAKLDIRQDSGSAIRCEDGSGGYFVVNQGGTVGIGTTSPQNLLHINRSDSLASAAQFTNSTTGATSSDGVFLGLGSGEQGYFWNFENNDLIFGTNNTERARILSSGNVGIGTSSPSTRLHTDVTGGDNELRVATTTSGDPSISFYANGAGAHQIAFDRSDLALTFTTVGSSERMRIDASGNVGIGTTSPSGLLNAHSASGDANVFITTGTTSAATTLFFGDSDSSSVGRVQYDHSDNSMRFQTSSTERARFDGSGNLLIGTTSDNVANQTGTTQGVRIAGAQNIQVASTGTAAYFNRLSTDGTIVEFRRAGTAIGSIGTNTTANFRITSTQSGHSGIEFGTATILPTIEGTGSNGGVDLGASTQRFKDLHVSNSVKNASGALSVESGGGAQLLLKASAELTFTANASERARVNTSGDFLVGTTNVNPAANNVTGHALKSGGLAEHANSGAVVMRLNRTDSDGDVLEFYKGTSKVGTIGIANGDLNIDGDTGIRFQADSLMPRSSGSDADATVDLGLSTHRFKDLHMSGSALIGSVQLNNGSASGPSHTFSADVDTGMFRATTNQLGFSTGGSERARIDSSGNLLVGTTSTTDSAVFSVFSSGTAASFRTTPTTATSLIIFRNGNGLVGSISTSGSATAFNTSSDQRLKANIVDAPSASDDIDAIQVRSFDWKADGSHQKYGMVAQELEGVAPEAVTGDADSDEMMGVDYSKLVPMMMKEIQSLRARVAQLEGVN